MATIAEMLVKLGMDASGFKSGASEAEGSVSKLEGSFKSLQTAGKKMTEVGKSISMGVTAPVVAAGAALIAFGASAQSAMQVERAFNDIAESAGTMGDVVLDAMQKSSRGLVSNTDLMKSFNLAASLVNEDFALKLPQAFEYLGKVSAATGSDMNYLLDSLVRGVGRLSPLILDNLGIQVSLTEAYDDYAKSIGKSSEELTKAEQQTAVSIAVMEKLRENTAAMSGEFGTASQQIKTAMENTKDAIGTNLVSALESAGEALVPVITKFGELFSAGGSLHPVITTLSDVMGKLVSGIENVVASLGNMDPAWVQTIINIGLFVAALGPILMVGGKVVSLVGSIGSGLLTMSTAMMGGAAGATALVAPLALVAAGIIAIGVAIVKHRADVDQYADSLAKARGEAVASGQSYESFAESIGEVGHTVEDANFNLAMHQGSLKDVKNALVQLGEASVITEKELAYWYNSVSTGQVTVEEAQEAVYGFVERQRDLEYATDQSAESIIEQSIAHAQLAHDLGITNTELDETIAEMEQMDKIASEAAGVKSLTANFSNMISYAQTYDSIQEQINQRLEAMAIIDVNGDGIADIGNAAQASQEDLEGLQGEVQALKGELDSLANQAALNMMQATIAIGGVTKAEAKLFFDTAVAMGEMTREGADAAYENYAASVDMMNLLELDPKTGEVSLEDQQFIMDVLALDGMTLAEKVAMINMELSGESSVKSAIDGLAKDRHITIYGHYSGPTVLPMAEGGDVTAGSPYMVGERGTELFVPKTDGEIIPHNKLRDLMIPYGMSSPTSISNTYNLTMPTTANAGDVRMAFELMEAWGT